MTMRLSIAAAALAFVPGILADMMNPPPPPPPGSACAMGSDVYPKPKLPKPKYGDDAVPITVENQRRSLGIASLPNMGIQWARDLLGAAGAAEDCAPMLGCACVTPGRKTPFGFLKKFQCPVGDHGIGATMLSCSVPEDGYKVR